MLFGDNGYTGPNGENLISLKQFYNEQSGGTLNINGTVTDWYSVSKNAAYYGESSGGSNDLRPRELVMETLNNLANDPTIDLSEFDKIDRYDLDGDGDYNEPDGMIDYLIVIHAGVGEEAGGGAQGSDAIWSHRWNLGGLYPIEGTEYTDENGNTDVIEVTAGTVYIKELSAPAGYKVDKTVYPLTIKAGETATLNVSDTPKVTDTLIELFKIDMETQKDNPQGNASLAGAEFTWKYYAGFYNKDNLPAEATRTWVTKTIAETDSDGTTHYITKLADAYKVSGDSFYMQDGKAVLPLGTLTIEETKAPNGYLLDGAYMQAGDKSEQIKGLYVTQITEDGDLAVLSGSNQFSVSDKVIRGGVKIQKRDLETGDTKPQGSATLKDTAFDIISLNDNAVLVEGKLYKKNEVVKIIRTDIEGIASTSADLLPYGKFRMNNEKSRNAGTGIFRSLFFLRP